MDTHTSAILKEETVALRLLAFGFVRRHSTVHFPSGVVLICVEYMQPWFDSILLSEKEMKLFAKVISATPATGLQELFAANRSKLLYRASRDGTDPAAFHRLCDGKPNTICLYQSNHGHVFGGFTCFPWSINTGYHRDEHAFLFVIRSTLPQHVGTLPIMYKLRNKELPAVFHGDDKGGTDLEYKPNDNLFISHMPPGHACWGSIDIDLTSQLKGYCRASSFDMKCANELCGGSKDQILYFDFVAKDIEVFQIETVE